MYITCSKCYMYLKVYELYSNNNNEKKYYCYFITDLNLDHKNEDKYI